MRKRARARKRPEVKMSDKPREGGVSVEGVA